MEDQKLETLNVKTKTDEDETYCLVELDNLKVGQLYYVNIEREFAEDNNFILFRAKKKNKLIPYVIDGYAKFTLCGLFEDQDGDFTGRILMCRGTDI